MVNGHPVFLRGLGEVGRAPGAPLILQRTEQDFLGAVLAELASERPHETVAHSLAASRNEKGVLRLYQPVHRTYHLALFDLACEAPGQPRLDPRKIESAGLVVRRLGPPLGEGWMEDGQRRRGWIPFSSVEEADSDPDPARRFAVPAGHPAVGLRLSQLRAGRELVRGGRPGPLSERASPLFVAPPEVCRKAGRTILYGVIPTASPEVSDMPAPRPGGAAPGSGQVFEADEIAAHIPGFLRAGKAASLTGIADRSFGYEQAVAEARHSSQMDIFLKFLRQLHIELDVFGDSLPVSRALFDELQKITLEVGSSSRAAGEYLRDAAEALAVPSKKSIRLPKSWPDISPGQADRFANLFGRALETRFQELAPRAPRFDRAGADYHLRGFVRLRRDDGCPPLLHWSAPSQPFVIAPWYDRGTVPPVQVELPAVTSKNLRDFKPNVAFKVPSPLFNLLQKNTPKQFLDGEAQEGDDDGIQWVCGFNIPIITLCAFIVLFIFLALLNIVFWWLPFIRICFPLPRLRR